MDITSDRFASEALKIIAEISESHFVAVDCEFSGITGRRPAGTGKLTLQELYEDTKAAAEQYQVLQVGLTIVKEDLEKKRYVVRPYNFTISPLPALRERTFVRKWSSTSGSMHFLLQHGFKHDMPFTSGVQYLSRNEESTIRARLIEDEERKAQYADMELKAKDQAVVDHIRTSIKDWLAQPEDQRDDFLNVPGEARGIPSTFNNFQIRLTHQIVRNEFTGLETKGMGHLVQITAPTEAQKASVRQIMSEEREKTLNRAIGFRWIIEAIVGGNITNIPTEIITSGLPHIDLAGQTPKRFLEALQEKLRMRNKVLVGHNCFGDMIYLYACFIGPLPDRVEDFATEFNMLCPAVVDTKHLASFTDRWGDTSLATVEERSQQQQAPKIIVPAEYDRYVNLATYHEAGFDAFLTANIMIRLPAKIEREQKYLDATKALKPSDAGHKEAAFGQDEEGYETAGEGEDEGLAERMRRSTISDAPAKKPVSAEMESMVARGELMPRWDGESGFWKLFGNKMQANACKEGIFLLK